MNYPDPPSKHEHESPLFTVFKEKLLTKKEELILLANNISGFNTKTTEQKIETLMRRLWEFLPPDLLSTFLEDPQTVRVKMLCHEAAIELFRQHPYLSLAPAVTRSLFGYPTKNDRKKKRGTGPQLRNEAKKRGFSPDRDLLEQFRIKLENIFLELPAHQDISKEWILFHLQLIQKLELFLSLTASQSIVDHFVPFIMQSHSFSDHSQESLDCLTALFTSIGLKHVTSDYINSNTSPDLVFQHESKNGAPITWYVELKEYHRGTRHSIHATAQVFKYLVENPHVILVSTEENFLIKEMEHARTMTALISIVNGHQQALATFMSNLDKSKNEIFKTYKEELKGHFTTKEETLFLCLFNDHFLHARGKIYAQIHALKEIKTLIKKLKNKDFVLEVLSEPTAEKIEDRIFNLSRKPSALLVIFKRKLNRWDEESSHVQVEG